MSLILYALLTVFLLSLGASPLAYSQPTGLDFDEPISQVAQDLANYHLQLANEEKARGNDTGYTYHFDLAGMAEGELGDFIDRVLDDQEIETIQTNGPGNCIIAGADSDNGSRNGYVLC
jgi:hypothetical protein